MMMMMMMMNSFPMLFIHSAFLVYSFHPHILLQIVLLVLHLVVGMTSNIPLLALDRISVCFFEMSCFYCIDWPSVTLCGCVHRADDIFVCFGAISLEIESGRGKGDPREGRGAVDKGIKRESSRQWRAEEDSPIEIAVLGKDGQQQDAEREDSQRCVSIPCVFVEV